MKKLFLFLTLFLLGALYSDVSAQETEFDQYDQKRIVYAEKYKDSHFLVVEKVEKSRIYCQRYKSNKQGLIAFDQKNLRKMNFFEDNISVFDVINSALLCGEQQPHLMLFAQTHFKDTSRFKLYMQFEESRKNFEEHLKKTRQDNKKLSDEDDKIDALYDVLHACELPKYIFRAIDTGDWIMASCFYKQYLSELKNLGKDYPASNYFNKDIRLSINETENNILKKYNSYIKEDYPELKAFNDATNENFGKKTAKNIQDLRMIFNSWQTSFVLIMNGEVDHSDNFRAWAHHMLNVLSASRTMPMAAPWRQDFNKNLKYYKMKNRKK